MKIGTEKTTPLHRHASGGSVGSRRVAAGLLTGWILTALHLLACGAPALTESATALDWAATLEDAQERAAMPPRPIVVMFTAPWCTYCKRMEAGALSDPFVRTFLTDYIPLRLDYDSHEEMAHRWGVDGLPAFVILTPEGELVERKVGFMDSHGLMEWMSGTTGRWQEAHDVEQQFTARSTRVLEKLASDSDAARGEALAETLADTNWSSERDRELAVNVFTTLASTTPALLLDQAQHPQLMVRILIANALRSAGATDHTFDPWLPPRTTP